MNIVCSYANSSVTLSGLIWKTGCRSHSPDMYDSMIDNSSDKLSTCRAIMRFDGLFGATTGLYKKM